MLAEAITELGGRSFATGQFFNSLRLAVSANITPLGDFRLQATSDGDEKMLRRENNARFKCLLGRVYHNSLTVLVVGSN